MSPASQAVWLRWKNHGLQVTTSFLFWKLDQSMKVFKNDKKPWFWVEFSLIFQTCILSKMKETLNQVFNPYLHNNIDLPRADEKDDWESARSLSFTCINYPHTPEQLWDWSSCWPVFTWESFTLLAQLHWMLAGIGDWLLEMPHARTAGSTTKASSNWALFVGAD